MTSEQLVETYIYSTCLESSMLKPTGKKCRVTRLAGSSTASAIVQHLKTLSYSFILH